MKQQCDCNDDIQQLFKNNKKWVAEINANDPDFFSGLANQQTPEYLWIGCSDSRVPANELVKMDPGTIFVHRNIANMVNSSDMNVLSVIQYAVKVLKVKHIIVNGHYDCGGVKASLLNDNPNLIEHWVRPIRNQYKRAKKDLDKLSHNEMINTLCEMNVKKQVRNLCDMPSVREAWQKGQQLSIHGFIYDIKDGNLHNLNVSVNKEILD